jgi:NitT/TauT family transport system substrate-binding protein
LSAEGAKEANIMLTRRRFIGASGAAVMAASLALPAKSATAPKVARIGYLADFPNSSLFAVANDQKLWEAEGIEPELKAFTNGPIQIQAMGAGSLDFGTIGPGALWLPASGRARVLSVNDIGFSDRVIAQPNIGSLADLKGQKVGVPQGTSGEMILRMALGKAGLSIADVQVVPMDPSTVVAAFASRQIAAAGIWYPLVDAIRAHAPDLKELASDKDFYPETSFINALVARNETVEQNPDLARSFLRVMKKAMDYRVANLDRAIALTVALTQSPAEATAQVARSRKLLTSAELATFTKDGSVARWLTNFNNMFVAFGTVKTPLPPEKYFDAGLFLSA